MSNAVSNPILRGFNPDPSIVRVGDDYYIATSTFEWFPGVQIHHSRDLLHWRLVARPLNRASQLAQLRSEALDGGEVFRVEPVARGVIEARGVRVLLQALQQALPLRR